MNTAGFKQLLLVLVPIVMGVVAQIFLKKGMLAVGKFALDYGNLPMQYAKIIFTPYVFLGMLLYFLGSLIWLVVLSRIPLSFAYPMLSMGYIFILFASAILFKEHISVVRWLGVIVICAGVFLISRS